MEKIIFYNILTSVILENTVQTVSFILRGRKL